MRFVLLFSCLTFILNGAPAIRTARARLASNTRSASPYAFRAVGFYGISAAQVIRVRTSIDGEHWTDWVEARREHTGTGALICFDQPQRWLEADTPAEVLFIDPGISAPPTAERRPATAVPPVVSRAEWGCTPENCAFRGGSPVYAPVTHLIVHHTAGGNIAADWPAVVRSIWALHVNGNGWSDIGYNYLIDPNGVLYEGRQGGDGVIGAHFSGVNTGTMGVSLMGTFSTTAPSPAAIDTLVAMLAWQASKWKLDPDGESLHASSQLRLNNISGHRDAGLSARASGATECPGNALYAILYRLRTDVASTADCPVRVRQSLWCAPAEGASAVLSIDAPRACDVMIESRASWLGARTDGTIAIAPNTGPRRTGVITVAGQSVEFSQSADGEPLLPCVAPRGILTAGTAQRSPAVPGSFISIYGSGFDTPTVTVNGSVDLPLIHTSPTHINAFLPANVATGSARLSVSNSGLRGPDQMFWITESAPVILATQNHTDSELNSEAAPVHAGEPLIVYLTGVGRSTVLSADIDGRAVQILFHGSLASFPGLHQANINIPAELGPGRHQVIIRSSGAASPAVEIFTSP